MADNTIGELFVEKTQNEDLKQLNWSDIQNRSPKCIAIIFTAWACGPCRDFDEKLVNFYKKANETQKNIELITVSIDYLENDWTRTYKNHLWPAIPRNDERIFPLKRNLTVHGIPTVLLLHNYTGEVVYSGRSDVEVKGPTPEVIQHWINLAEKGTDDPLVEQIVTTDLFEEIRIKKQKARENNILLRKCQKAQGEIIPLERMKVWALFESYMEKKYKSDTSLIKAKKRPINMPEFMWSLLQETYQNPGEAEHMCARLCLSLKILLEEKHEYGTIFCRLLQIYHPDPVDLGLAMFDVKSRFNFERQLKMLIKKQQALQQNNQKNFADKLTYELEEFAQQGGYIPLIDISDLVYSQFAKDRDCGYRVMERLLPNNEAKVEFTLFIVCWNIAKQQKQPKDLFKVMDKEGSGTVETSQFTEGIKDFLGVWLSDREVKNIHQYMDADNTGDIEYKEFMAKINFVSKKYKDKNAWLCSKATLLTAIADEYDDKRIRDFESLKRLFVESDKDGTGSLEIQEFSELCIKLEPSLEQSKIQEYFEEALNITQSSEPNSINSAAFAVIVMNHNIGGFGSGIFSVKNLLGGEEPGQEKTPTPRTAEPKKK